MILARRLLAWIAALLVALVVVMGGLAAAVEAGFCRGLLVRSFSARVSRAVQVDGPIKARLFTSTPTITADQVTIGNPPWMPAGTAAKVAHIGLTLQMPGFGHRAGIIELQVQGAALYLIRDMTGHSNWQLTSAPHSTVNERSPIIRSLSVPDAHVELADALHHLQFVGTVSASGPEGSGSPEPLKIVGSGQLNGRAASFELTGDPLGTASHRSPYRFTFSERSGESTIDGQGNLPKPFDFDILEATFTSVGPDLKDLYFLTGVHLLDTGAYRLTGRYSRHETRTEFSDLKVSSGQSDMRGTVSIDASGPRRTYSLDLASQTLHLADLGARAAGRAPGPPPTLLLSNAMLSPVALRAGDGTVKFIATQVYIGKLPLNSVSASATIDHAVLTVTSLTGGVLGGRLDAHLRLDAGKDLPAASADVQIAGLQLGKLAHKDPEHPPLEGLLQARLKATGTGSSVHQIAASSEGTLQLQVRNGTVRESFAELTGIDLRGIGLLLTHNLQAIPVRCASALFSAHAGTLSTQSLMADTEPVLITGQGQVHLDSETISLRISGHPKHVRLFRLRAPLLVGGTLAHPSIGVQRDKAELVIVDPGKAPDADCSGSGAGT